MSGDLVEVSDVRQIPGEARRRWFSSQAMDLILWHGESGEITSFQLCYDKLYRERAIIWQLGRRELVHMTVDDGESVGCATRPRRSSWLTAHFVPPMCYGILLKRQRDCRRKWFQRL